MPVYYNNNALIPAPFVDISEEFTKNDMGEIIGSVFNITLKGKLVGWKGSPTSSGTFWTNSGYPPDENIPQTSRLTSMINKQKAIENLFGIQGRTFQVTGLDGQNVLVCNPLVNAINFAEGFWTEACDYVIQLQANQINGVVNPGSGLNLKAASESWQIEMNEQPESDAIPQAFRVTHNLSAQGLLVYNSDGSFTDPVVWAQNWVLPRLGFSSTFGYGSGVTNAPTYLTPWNQVRTTNIDRKAAIFSATESWVMSSGNALEDFTVDTRTSIDTGVTDVSIQGTITGLETRDSNNQITISKYTAASGKFESIRNNIFQRAQSYSNTALNPNPVTTDIGRNPIAGVISYAYAYNTRPTNYVSGVTSEIITIVDNLPADVFATIPVLGRTQGPVLQALGTITEKTRTLTIELVFPAQSLGNNVNSLTLAFNNNPRVTAPFSNGINDIILAATPTSANSLVFQTNIQESYSPKTGHYSHTRTYTYT